MPAAAYFNNQTIPKDSYLTNNMRKSIIMRTTFASPKLYFKELNLLWTRPGLNRRPSDYESDATNQLSYEAKIAKPATRTGLANIVFFLEF